MTQPKAIIFDLGNVLVTVDNALSVPKFAPYLEKELELAELESLLYGFTKQRGWGREAGKTQLHEDYHIGKISSADFFQALRQVLPFKSDFTVKQFQKLWPDRFMRKEKSIALLKQLSALRKYMLSDTNEMDANLLQILYPDIFAEFDELFFSHQTHVDKYSYDAWKNVIKKSGLKAKEHLFVDDKADHVQRAKKLGIQGIVFENPEQLERELQTVGLL